MMKVTIGQYETELLPLEAIRVIATRFGYDDVDFEPTDNGYKLTATGKGMADVHVSGKTAAVIVQRFLDKVNF